MSFSNYIQNFAVVTANEVEKNILASEEYVVFIGRETCPYCQRFAPKISEVAKTENIKVDFLDSSDAGDSSLADLRNKYGVRTVPGLLVAKKSQVKVVCDSSLSTEEIINFIKG